jgi:hypothetical protein
VFTRQNGSSLLLGLLLLALLSLLVTNAVSENRWQQRVATHELGEARAESAARSAVVWAEDWLMSLPGDIRPDLCTGDCTVTPIHAPGSLPGAPERLDERWWLEHAYPQGTDPLTKAQSSATGDPRTPAGRWIVSEVHFAPAGTLGIGVPDVGFYRVVARAARAPAGTPIVIETIVARPWGDVNWTDPLPPTESSFCHVGGMSAPCGRMTWRRRL